jgi:hypothetical protein
VRAIEVIAMRTELVGLTAEQFRQITERLRSDVPSRGSIEKRNAPRVGMRTKLQIFANGDERYPLNAWLRDLSATGMGLVLSHALPRACEFLVKFPLNGQESLAVYYSVRHCKELGKNLYFIGAKLDRIIE